MKKRYTQQQIVAILMEGEAGVPDNAGRSKQIALSEP